MLDYQFELPFYDDYENAPSEIRKAFDKILRIIDEHGGFPRGMREHTSATSDIYMGQVTVRRGAWRVLYWKDDSLITFVRLLNHREYEKALKEF